MNAYEGSDGRWSAKLGDDGASRFHPFVVAIFDTNTRGVVAKSERDGSGWPRYPFGMLSEWLRNALESAKISQAEAARQLTERLGRSVDRAAVNKMVKGTRSISADEMVVLEELTGMPTPDDLIPIVGRAGAATDGAVAYAEGQGNFGHVPRPRGAAPNTVALEIHGGSMGYLADGSIVLYSERHPQPLPDMVGQAVVVGLPGDMVLLKRLLRGSEPGLWDLESINGPTLPDQPVDWFSHIDFIVPPWRAAQLRLP